jgi:hypothetical protein
MSRVHCRSLTLPPPSVSLWTPLRAWEERRATRGAAKKGERDTRTSARGGRRCGVVVSSGVTGMSNDEWWWCNDGKLI